MDEGRRGGSGREGRSFLLVCLETPDGHRRAVALDARFNSLWSVLVGSEEKESLMRAGRDPSPFQLHAVRQSSRLRLEPALTARGGGHCATRRAELLPLPRSKTFQKEHNTYPQLPLEHFPRPFLPPPLPPSTSRRRPVYSRPPAPPKLEFPSCTARELAKRLGTGFCVSVVGAPILPSSPHLFRAETRSFEASKPPAGAQAFSGSSGQLAFPNERQMAR